MRGAIFLIICYCIYFVDAYIPQPASVVKNSQVSTTSLFAHHVQKKITKRMMDRRPKKHRLSDINRVNINLNKCISKVENAPSDYTIITAADYMAVREKALKFWDEGDSAAPWLELTAEDMVVTFPQNLEPLTSSQKAAIDPFGKIMPKLARRENKFA